MRPSNTLSTAPIVSVLMSVYNGSRYLPAAIESILGQTFSDFEFIIIDDGSTDDSASIIKGYDDPRIVLISNTTNIGLTKSLNKGLRLARGRYIARQDADDISYPHRLAWEKAFLDQHDEVVLVSGEMEFIDESNEVFHRPRLAAPPLLVKWYLLFYNRIGGHSQVMFRKEPVLSLGGYDESYRYSQDYALWLRLAEEWDLAILDDVIIRYRCAHATSITQTRKEEQLFYALRAAKRHVELLLHRPISLETMQILRTFWENGRLSPRQTLQAQKTIRAIYRAFVRKKKPPAEIKERILRAIIDQTFLHLRRQNRRTRLPWYPHVLKEIFALTPREGVRTCHRLLRSTFLVRHRGTRTR